MVNVFCFNRHIDGHHKLIHWRLVIHGGIDGYSRCIVYLRCSPSNYASTALDLFRSAVQRFGLPSRVRSDLGGENVDVAKFMLHNPERGINRGSMITGTSVHNQRIERLWVDLRRVLVSYYTRLFSHLENAGVLDRLNEVHLFALHYVFLPRINRGIDEFVLDWNNHPLSSAGNRSPLSVWYSGVTSSINTQYSAGQNIVEGQDWSTFGIDEDGPVAESTSDNLVEVAEVSVPLTHRQLQELRENISP